MQSAVQGDECILRLDQPFDWHAFVVQQVSAAFDKAVWKCRDAIREMEKQRPDTFSKRPRHSDMHDLARHTIHITETISMAITVVDAIFQEGMAMSEVSVTNASASAGVHCLDTNQELKCQITLLRCAHERSQALTYRLQNEMSLVGMADCRHKNSVDR